MKFKKASKNNKWIVIQERGSNIPLFPATSILFEAFTSREMKNAVGIKGSVVLIDWIKSGGRFFTLEKEWKRFCDACYKKVRADPLFLHKLKRKFKSLVPKFLTFTEKLYKTNLRKKTNKELWNYYATYIKLYKELYPFGESIPFGSRYGLEKYLSSYLKKILKKFGKEDKFDEYFNILITPKEKPFIIKEKEDLLKIAVQIEKNKKQIKDPSINKLIEKHEKKFTWVPYNYGNGLWKKEDFIIRLKKILRKGKIQKELKALQNRFKNLPKKQKQIFNELKIDSYHKKLFSALQVNAFLIDYKKEIYTISHFHFNKSLMLEIAKRLNLTFWQVSSLSPEETKRALLKNIIPSSSMLQERWKFCVLYIDNNKTIVFQGKNAKKFLDKIGFVLEELGEFKEIKGQPACKGFYKGIVKIVPSPKDIHKMRKGDILVTFMTTPEFVPAIKKAGAIITNEGGITCHAAIISRELNIPCVIGTRIATKVLKDGDLVEVDATNGIIKKLE